MSIRDLRQDRSSWFILEERARALATQKVAVAMVPGEEMLYFRLGDDQYAVPAQSVREVQPLGQFTTLPATPAHIVGLVNIRGRLLTALDLRPLLNLPLAPPATTAQLIILATNDGDIGFLADAVIAVERSDGHLAPVPSATAGRGVMWVRGVDRHMHLLIDPALLFTDPRLIVTSAVG